MELSRSFFVSERVCIWVNSPRKTARKNAWGFLHLHPPIGRFQGPGARCFFLFAFRFETLRKIRVSWDLGSLIMVLYDMVMIPMHLGWHFVNNRFVCFEATGYRPVQHRKQTIDILLWRGRLKFNHVIYGYFVSFDIYSYF